MIYIIGNCKNNIRIVLRKNKFVRIILRKEQTQWQSQFRKKKDYLQYILRIRLIR